MNGSPALRGRIRELGEKLFTRIKDRDEQAAIRTFLAQQP
jgi:hypothetical protein